MSNEKYYTWAQFRALPFELRDGVEQFWEPGYDYDSSDFWASYKPREVTQEDVEAYKADYFDPPCDEGLWDELKEKAAEDRKEFIAGVQMYDWLQKNNPEDE